MICVVLICGMVNGVLVVGLFGVVLGYVKCGRLIV